MYTDQIQNGHDFISFLISIRIIFCIDVRKLFPYEVLDKNPWNTIMCIINRQVSLVPRDMFSDDEMVLVSMLGCALAALMTLSHSGN